MNLESLTVSGNTSFNESFGGCGREGSFIPGFFTTDGLQSLALCGGFSFPRTGRFRITRASTPPIGSREGGVVHPRIFCCSLSAIPGTVRGVVELEPDFWSLFPHKIP